MKEGAKRLLITALLSVMAVIMVFPLVLTVTNSFMSEAEISSSYDKVDEGGGYVVMKLIPELVVLSQYYDVLVKKTQFLYMFWNSVIIVLPIAAGQTFIAGMAAYAFAKLRFKGRDQLFFLYLVVMLMPFQVTLVPNYLMAEKLGLINNYLSIILPGIFNTFGVFLLKQYMEQIPDSYIEAAKMDGAGPFQIFFRIVLPMCNNGIAAMFILLFIDNWNMVEQPLIFLQDAAKQPLSVYLSRIISGERGLAFAASTLYMLPMLLIFLYGENYLVEGIQRSGIRE